VLRRERRVEKAEPAADAPRRRNDNTVPTDLPWTHDSVMSYAYVLALTTRHRERLSVLDWGGGVGQFLD
jgi:hypothetical protein